MFGKGKMDPVTQAFQVMKIYGKAGMEGKNR